MHIKRLQLDEIEKFWSSHMLEYIPHLKLHVANSTDIIVCWPETPDLKSFETHAQKDLDIAFINFRLFPRQEGVLDSAIALCDCPILILNNSEVREQVWTDSDGKLFVGEVDVDQYFDILKQKLEYCKIEDLIDSLPDGSVGFYLNKNYTYANS